MLQADQVQDHWHMASVLQLATTVAMVIFGRSFVSASANRLQLVEWQIPGAYVDLSTDYGQGGIAVEDRNNDTDSDGDIVMLDNYPQTRKHDPVDGTSVSHFIFSRK